MTVVRKASAVVVGVLLAVACGDDDSSSDDEQGFDVEETVEFAADAEPAALAALPDGEVLVGERRTGAIRVVNPDGDLGDPIVQLDVQSSQDDQRGLLGLAVDDETIYAAWTRASDGHIVVAEVTDGAERLIWEGPVSSDRANGGHLDVSDGRIVIGIGDLEDPALVDEAAAPNGKLLALDPSAAPNQKPATLSDGWNNPFAFVVLRNGDIWVADNSPGDDPERIGRGDGPSARSELPGARAPSALVELASDRLGLCGYLDGKLTLVELDGDEPVVTDTTPSSDCRTGAVVLTDGRIAISDGERVRILRQG